MNQTDNRFKILEKYMTVVLMALAGIFLLFIIASSCGVIWLKVITAIITIGASALCIAFFYKTKLLLQSRSLWMTVAAVSLIICTVFSLIVHFPAPL